jgi:segregation and condensation protein B
MATRAPYMRLVSDQDPAPQQLEPMAAKPQEEAQQSSEPAPRRRKRRATVTAEIAESEVANERPANEHPDGQVVDAVDEESSDDSAPSSDIAINLAALEALLFSTHHPLTAGRLAEMLELESTKPVRAAIKQLNEQYEQTNRSFRVEQVAGGYQLLTLPQYGEMLKRLHQKEVDAKLTKAALETLAIIAYKQPILRVDVEAIRGVACGETIRSLMEKHLVKIAGRAEEPGRPILYGTTKRFLELFGLNSLKDLPQAEGFAPPKSIAPAPELEPEPDAGQTDEPQAESA